MIQYVEKGIGLHDAIRAAGHWLDHRDGVWVSSDDVAVQAIIDGYDELAAAKAQKLAALAELRWKKETGGALVAGLPVATDDRSQLKITGARLAADADPDYTVNWKVGAGAFVALTAAQIIAISDAVRAHVQACFDREDALATEINAAATIADVEAVDITTGWP
jgi:hypothetical protein